LNLEPLTVNF